MISELLSNLLLGIAMLAVWGNLLHNSIKQGENGLIIISCILVLLVVIIVYNITKKLMHILMILRKGELTYGVIVTVEERYSPLSSRRGRNRTRKYYGVVKVVMEDNTVRPFENVRLETGGLGSVVFVKYYKDEVIILKNKKWKQGDKQISGDVAVALERIRRTHRL